MTTVKRRLTIPELACAAAISLWTIAEYHQVVATSSISKLLQADKVLTLTKSYENLKIALGSFQKSLLEMNTTQMDELSSRAAITSLMTQTGLNQLDIPELTFITQPNSSLSTYMIMEKRRQLLASIPSGSPAEGWFTSGFGTRVDPVTGRKSDHRGLDISNDTGTPIIAPADGIIRYASTFGKFGNYISIVHGHGVLTKYGHLKEIRVKAGQLVHKGDVIGLMGQSGKSTGVHLHYEIWINDHAFNPYAFLPKVMRYNNPDRTPQQKFMLLAGQP